MSFGDEWEEFVERLARDLAPALLRRIYGLHLERMRRLKMSSEKLVYLYLLIAQPQSYTTLRRGLNLSDKVLSKALRGLKERRCMIRDRRFLYGINEVVSGDKY